MKILNIVGARPQFIKAAMVSRAILSHNEQHKGSQLIEDILVHTGQHYDENMSSIFFEELGISKPKYNLKIGSGTHGDTTGRMLLGLEKIMILENPDWVLVYGDTNSTLAGALAAAKLHIPICHVEAGLRSFNKKMPEEINRICTDHVSNLLFCPTTTAVHNLQNEGVTTGVHHVGDVMFDAAIAFGLMADKESQIIEKQAIEPGNYYLATVHRAENTDFPERLKEIFIAFAKIATEQCPLIFPVHPRTSKWIERDTIGKFLLINRMVKLIEPVSYIDMVMLEKNARLILTDSGGVQKEAYFHNVPCITLRDETEWVETVAAGWNQVVGANSKKIIDAVECNVSNRQDVFEYGSGNTGVLILNILKGVH